MTGAMWVAVGALGFFGFIAIHEGGHLIAARLIGVPSDQVTIRLRQWPAHVALRSGETWHEPGTAAYEEVYARHDPQLRWLGPFVAAGFVVQTAVMIVVSVGCVAAGFDDLGRRLVRISLVINGIYLVADAVGSIAARAPTGDMSSMLRHTPLAGVSALALLIAGHIAAWVLT